MKINYLDLFHGIGGFAIGAYWAGLKADRHFCSDIEPYAVDLYAKRFPESVQLGDITKIDWQKLKSENHGEWIITGGFPCQDISCAGKGAGIHEGKRSSLWFNYRDAIGVLRPRFAIMENVGTLTIRGLDAVLGSLSEIGYDAEWQDIRAEDMGAPHRRERIWIMAYPGCELREQGNPVGMEADPPERSTGKLHDKSSRSGQDEMADAQSEGLERQEPEGSRPGESGLPAECSWWTVEPAVCRVADGLPDELDGYQGRLSNKSFHRADKLRGLGNSIVPMIAERLFKLLL